MIATPPCCQTSCWRTDIACQGSPLRRPRVHRSGSAPSRLSPSLAFHGPLPLRQFISFRLRGPHVR